MADWAWAKQTQFWNLGRLSLSFRLARPRFHAPTASRNQACGFRLRRPFFPTTFFGRVKKVVIKDTHDSPSGPEDLQKKSEERREEGYHVSSGGEEKMLPRVKYRHFRGQMELIPPTGQEET
jgi:hypothetical protein